MKKSLKSRVRSARRREFRRNVLRLERLEDRMVMSGASPEANNDLYHALVDETLDVATPGILANDTDAEGDALTAQLFSGPAHGTLSLDASGAFQYTPEAGYSGIDSFMYQANDGTSNSLLAAVTLRVGNGSPPQSLDDSYTMNEDGVLNIPAVPGVLHNDSDPDGDPLTAELVTGPANGTVSLAADGSFTYTPSANFHGSDTFTYTASDGTQTGNVATVTINVNSINDSPLARNDAFSVDEDNPLHVSAPGILANDSDADGDALTASLVSAPLHGTLSLNADGSFDYTPAENFHGVDGFSYLINDGTVNSNVATVTIDVRSINDMPVAAGDQYSVDEDTTLTIDAPGVLANDSDVDGDALSAILVTGPANGTLTLNADGSFSFTPNANFYGEDSFVYQASDGSLAADATVVITVNPVNDVPVASNDEYATDEDTPLQIVAPGVLANDSDADGDTLTTTLVSGPVNGTVTLNADGSFLYTPSANFNGTDGFSYTASDGTAESDVASVTINVASINDTPIATNDEYSTDEDTQLIVDPSGVLANDSDADGDSLTATLVSGPVNGTVTLNADGSFVYTPNANFNGVDGFSYTAGDGSAESDVATVTINVNSINDAPTAVNDEFSVAEDNTLIVDAPGILANDTDPEGDTLAASLVSGPINGTLTLNADGSFTYVPSANFNGTDGFSYLVSDGSAESAVATVTINVSPENDAPVAAADEYAMSEDETLTVDAPGLLANDSDVDGDPLSAILVSGPASGALTLNTDGSFTYTPSADFNGSDSFVYKASDGSLESGETTVTINVHPVNDAPVAANDEYATDEDSPLSIVAPGVLTNDSDVDGDALTTSIVTGPANGAVTLNGDGSFEYTPAANFHGTDSFTYTASDGSLTSSEATVTITVNSVNDAPLATNDEYATSEDTPLVVDAPGLLANDSDADGDSLTATLVSGPVNGSVTLNADGSFTYTPSADFTGIDGFSYTVSDGTTESDVATVTIDVGAVNDAPIANGDAYATDEDTTLTIDAPGVLANDSDIDGDALTATLITGPTNGTVTLNADGSFSYTPSANFNGADSFTYSASDGSLTSGEATVTITVGSVNDAPVALDDGYTIDEDSSLIVDAPGVMSNDSDPDGDPISATLVSGPASGTVEFQSDGSFVYIPGANFTGTDTFTYKVSDGSLESNTASVCISVTPVNDAPVATADEYVTDEDLPLTIDAPGVLANDSDADGDALSATIVSGPANGSVTVNSNGSFSYTPNANFNGSDSFVYAASDGSAESQATVTIRVNPVADAPIAHNDAYNVGEDNTLAIGTSMGVLANDFDPEGRPLTAELVSGPTDGTLTLNADGSFNYVPQANYVGTDTFTYVATNGVESSAEMTVTIEVQTINDAPVAVDDSYNLGTQSEISVDSALGVIANDSDIEGDPLAATLLWGPSHGTLTLNADGSFDYAADAGYTGSDEFKYQLYDGVANSNVATVTLQIGDSGENQSPESANDSYAVDAGATLTVDAPGVLANDSDADGDPLTATLVNGPSGGSLALAADGSFVYTPSDGFIGGDSFTYVANDGTADGNIATVNITVRDPSGNDAPQAAGDIYSTSAETTLDIPAAGVLVNDTDADGDPLTAVLVAAPAHGTVTLQSDGSFSYSPEIGFTGTDSFTYQASDGTALSNVATVEIKVGSAGNHRPVATNDHFTATMNGSLEVPAPGLLANDSDPDGDALTASVFSPPQHGTLALQADGSFVYTPETDFQGRDSFIYWIYDGEVHSALAAVTIYVVPGQPLQLAAGKAADPGASSLSMSQLQPIIAAAQDRLSDLLGADAAAELIASTSFSITDLPGNALGLTTESRVEIDINAAGVGWFIDPTPGNEEIASADDGQDESQLVDLLTVVLHELGHRLGNVDEHGSTDLMDSFLASGERRETQAEDFDAVLADDSWLL